MDLHAKICYNVVLLCIFIFNLTSFAQTPYQEAGMADVYGYWDGVKYYTIT
jgi:hypothetical protein